MWKQSIWPSLWFLFLYLFSLTYICSVARFVVPIQGLMELTGHFVVCLWLLIKLQVTRKCLLTVSDCGDWIFVVVSLFFWKFLMMIFSFFLMVLLLASDWQFLSTFSGLKSCLWRTRKPSLQLPIYWRCQCPEQLFAVPIYHAPYLVFPLICCWKVGGLESGCYASETEWFWL